MNIADRIKENINHINSTNFEECCIEVFRFQYANNLSYKSFCDYLKVDPLSIDTISKIPFLPIQQFKNSIIKSTDFESEAVFSSSGTSTSITSQHHVKYLCIYEQSFNTAFQQFYGKIEDYCILALLPSYLERKGSSLIYMVDNLVKKSNKKESGFYLYNFDDLHRQLQQLKSAKQKTILIGVSFALIDFVEKYKIEGFEELIVMETGGMKGKRKELIRSELHEILKNGFGLNHIHSEYGMTELLSQAYSTDGKFYCPPWMKVLTRSVDDPFEYIYEKTGGVNIIDLANIYSCAFIQTDDLGNCHEDGSFEVLGRFDQSEIRGCNLMVT